MMNDTTELVPLRRLGPGLYQTLDGWVNVERDDEGLTECSHPLCDTLHERHRNGDGVHWVTYTAWHLWDNEADDYLDGNRTYDTKREARVALTEYLQREGWMP